MACCAGLATASDWAWEGGNLVFDLECVIMALEDEITVGAALTAPTQHANRYMLNTHSESGTPTSIKIAREQSSLCCYQTQLVKMHIVLF